PAELSADVAEDEPLYLVRLFGGIRQADHPAERGADEDDALEPEALRRHADVATVVGQGIGLGRKLVAAAATPRRERDDVILIRESGRDEIPVMRGSVPAVDEQH